jgi:pimeloyl-ACP methyl ester carboxylesterase
VKGRRSDTPLIWLLTGTALLAAMWAAAVALMRRLRLRRRRRPALEAIPVTPSYAGGAGTPLVLLHGVGGTWRVWRPVLPLLERWHAVFAPTLPGHCGAERLAPGVVPSIHALADGVVEQLDRAGIDRAHIVGNSLGGWIALELARRGRARSVVLFGPAGAWRSAARMTAVAAGMRLSFALLARQTGRAEAIARRRWARRLLLATQVEHPDRVDPAEFAASVRAMKDSPVVAPLLRVITKHPLEHLPADPDCPIRVVWAERDRIIPFEHNGLALLERVPGAELVRLAGVGHVPMPDDPEQVARLILEVTDAVDRGHEKDRAVPPIAPHARPSEAS